VALVNGPRDLTRKNGRRPIKSLLTKPVAEGRSPHHFSSLSPVQPSLLNLLSMLNKFSLRLPIRHVLASYKSKNCQSFTTVSLHSRLPATVYRLQLLPKSNLSAYMNDESSDIEEQVLVSNDRLVYPRVSDKVPSTYHKTLPRRLLTKNFPRFKWTSFHA
jgi:hypothetical protein